MSKETWMAPGNSKIFDSSFEDGGKINLRTLGVLEYIKESSIENGYVSKKQFEKEIKDFLEKNYSLEKNKSTSSHFFRTSLFYGFLEMNKKNQLRMTIEGGIFLKKYNQKKFIEAKKYFINQLENTKYPNIGAKDTNNLYLYPFRILFKLLLENKTISTSFIKKRLINIKKYDNLKKYIEKGSLNFILPIKINSERENKFHTWVVNSLADVGVLKKDGDKYSIHRDVLGQVKFLYDNVEYKDMFFGENIDTDELDEIISGKRQKRNPHLIKLAKKRDKNKCIRNLLHKTFDSGEMQYTEGHHLLPLYQQKNFVDFKIDDKENIVSLCPNCHREIHFSDNKQDIVDKLYKKRISFFKKHNLDKNILYKVYNV